MPKHHDIHNPSHYTEGRKIQPLDVILDWCPGDYLLGSIIKYLARTGRKDDPIQDLEKARFYLDRKIHHLKSLRDRGAMPFDFPNPDE